jgi:hypothetical protein
MSKRKDPEAKNGIENHTDQSTALTSLELKLKENSKSTTSTTLSLCERAIGEQQETWN